MAQRRVRIGLFESVRAAIVGALVGVFLFFASIALLWINEGRHNLATIARRSIATDPARVDSANDRALVSVTERVRASTALSDESFLVPGPFVTLARRAEMFAWIERCDDRSNCHYSQHWTDAPPASAHFREPRGHTNPAMRVRAGRYSVDASIGAFSFRTAETNAPCDERVQLSREMLRPDAPHSPAVTSQHYLYIGDRSIDQPAVGDVRLSYYALRTETLTTLFGQQNGSRIDAYQGEARLYRLLRGDRASAIRQLAHEHFVIGWLLRFAGFLLVWVSMNLWLGPVSAMFDVFPPLARATRSVVAMVTLPLALGLAATVAVISAIAHSLALLVLVLSLLCFVALTQRNRGR
ncbi:MAG: TMEM43 family protein [Polyangiales bacterium]